MLSRKNVDQTRLPPTLRRKARFPYESPGRARRVASPAASVT